MGSAISLLALSKDPQLFAGAVLSSPMLGIDTGAFPGLVARVLAAIGAWAFAGEYAPGRGKWKPDPNLSADTSLVSHDPERCRVLETWYTAVPELRVDGATYGWVKSALDVTDRLANPAVLARVTTPLLLGVAMEEHHVVPQATERAAKLLPHASLLSFPTARHELFFERNDIRGPWLAAIEQFIATRLP
jgi:lysophospholipase